MRAGARRRAAAGLPVLLLCFHFDPLTGRYSLAIMRLVRLAAVLFVLTVSGMLWLLVPARADRMNVRLPRPPHNGREIDHLLLGAAGDRRWRCCCWCSG